jgi:hypothetical protein
VLPPVGLNIVKPLLSVAYVTAVAARAGCEVLHPVIDMQSVDAAVRTTVGPRLTVDLQLKSTSRACINGDDVVYDLPAKNYRDLRSDGAVPIFLVVMVLAAEEDSWLAGDEEALLLRHCAYWMDLTPLPPSDSRSTVRIRVPRSQRFDVPALLSMLEAARKRT